MAMLRILVLLILLGAPACTQSTYLTKPGLNDEIYRRDSAACAEYKRDQSQFYDCMTARGYTTEHVSILPKIQRIGRD